MMVFLKFGVIWVYFVVSLLFGLMIMLVVYLFV